MTSEEAIQIVRERFPFERYMEPEKDAYLNIAKIVLRYLQPGDKVLDFGAGPCDKTAIVQTLGFKCSAYDDLQDDWHKIEGNRDKIIAFAKEFGIDFKIASDNPLPFEKSSFDMLMMHAVLEHLDSPRNLLNNLLELVKPEGYFFATVPNAVNIRNRIRVLFGKTNLPRFEVYYWYPGSWRGHIREYTKGDFVKFSEYLNMDIVELRSYHHMLKKLPSVVLRPFYLGITSVFTGWRDSWLLVAKKRTGWVPRKTLPQDELRKIFGTATSYQY